MTTPVPSDDVEPAAVAATTPSRQRPAASDKHSSTASPSSAGAKRKLRANAACVPCRSRKVRCSGGAPCRTCAERGHPESCSYLSVIKRARTPATSTAAAAAAAGQPPPPSTQRGAGGPAWEPSRAAWRELCAGVGELRAEVARVARDTRRLLLLRAAEDDHNPLAGAGCDGDGGGSSSDGSCSGCSAWSRGEQSTPPSNSGDGVHATDDIVDVYIGANSAPAFAAAVATGRAAAPACLPADVLPTFVLGDDRATYPFESLWGLQQGPGVKVERLRGLIPGDDECAKIYREYCRAAFVMFPAVVDVEGFEKALVEFIAERRRRPEMVVAQSLQEQRVYGQDMHWLGLFFAVMASGLQCSDRALDDRDLKSNVYVCCAYECLRIVNYLSHSTLDDIQTLLVLGNVISDNMNSGTAWSLLGLTSRLAQGQGLDHEPPSWLSPNQQKARVAVWQCIVWQDSLISMAYDRTPTLVDYATHRSASPLSYADCMFELCHAGCGILRERARSTTHPRSPRHRQRPDATKWERRIAAITHRAQPHLRALEACASPRDRIEHWTLALHRSYLLAELTKPALKPPTADGPAPSPPTTVTVANGAAGAVGDGGVARGRCLSHLADTVTAFLALRAQARFAARAWTAVQRALSCAALLAVALGPRAPRPRRQRGGSLAEAEAEEDEEERRARSLLARFVGGGGGGGVESGARGPVERAVGEVRRLMCWERDGAVGGAGGRWPSSSSVVAGGQPWATAPSPSMGQSPPEFRFYGLDELVPQDAVFMTNRYAIGNSVVLDHGSGVALESMTAERPSRVDMTVMKKGVLCVDESEPMALQPMT